MRRAIIIYRSIDILDFFFILKTSNAFLLPKYYKLFIWSTRKVANRFSVHLLHKENKEWEVKGIMSMSKGLQNGEKKQERKKIGDNFFF